MLTLRIGGGYRVAEALVKRWPSAETLIGGIGYGMVLATVYLLFFAAAHGAATRRRTWPDAFRTW